MISFCRSSTAAPPMDSVSPDASIVTDLMASELNSAVTVTSLLWPLALAV